MSYLSFRALSVSALRLTVVSIMCLLLSLHAHAEPVSDANNKLITSALIEYQQVAVKVSFSDEKTGRNIARGFEPLKTEFDQGFVILVLDSSEYTALQQAAESMAITVDYDEATMQRYIFSDATESQYRQGNVFSRSQNLAVENSFNGVVYPSIAGFDCYRTVEGTYSTAQDIVAAFPNLASWQDIGDSWEKTVGQGGYDIQALTLTNNAIAGPKPAILMTGGIHAREYTPVELLIRFAEHLVTSYGNDADVTWILDHHTVHIIPIANPDGRKRAETGLLWRKNVNENYCGATSNSRGADLNRNFQFAWGCCGGSSSSECNQTYRGAFAASEPETQAVQNFLFNNFADNRGPNITDAAPLSTQGMYIDIHSSGQFVLWPWGFSAAQTPNGTALQTLGRRLAFPNNHSPEQAASSFTTDGETDSFGYGELGLPSYTYELGTEFFQACSVFENTIVPDNFASLMYALKVLRAPYVTPAGPNSYNVALSINSAVPAGTLVDISATIDDTQFNNSNGTEATQSISNAEYYIDVPPWQAGASANALSANDGAFNSATETVSAAIDTSSLSQGQHIVYVRGQDSSGTWGEISAVFLDIDNSAPVPVTLFSDDFESDLGWTTNPSGSDTATTGQWERGDPEEVVYQGVFTQLPDSVSGTNNLVTGRLRGPGVGSFDIDSGVTSVRSPDIAIPAGAQSVNLSLSQYLYHSSNSSSADFLTISVVGNNTSVVLDERGTNSIRAAQWASFNTDITAFAGQTIHVLIEAADASNGSLVETGIDDVVITAVVNAPTNQAPSVDAGADQSISLPNTAALSGNATDDGLPSNTLTTTWSVVSGPGSVTFGDASATSTTATFTSNGTYVLRLSANDGDLSSSDDITITVEPQNSAPTANAGANQSITLPSNATLSGSASDDGLPSNSLTTLWSQISGPGAASFGNANALITPVSFSSAGTYVLRLTTNDSELTDTDDVVVVVNPAPPVNQAPTVSAGANQTITLPESVNLSGSVNDDGLPSGTLTSTWSQVSGSGTVSFGDANSAATSASFSTSGTYVLRLTGNDGALSNSDDVTITVQPVPPVNQAPNVNAGADQTVTLPSTASLSGTSSDDGLPSGSLTNTWSLLSGPGTVTFGNSNALNTTASFSAAGNYVLRLTANDGALSSSDDVAIQVDPAPVSNNFETMVLSKINTVWQTMSFTNSYTNPVVVCTPQYSRSELPAVVRVRNVSGSGFEVKVQNPSNSALNDLAVFCLAMESGRWTMPDGRLIEAQIYNSTVTDRAGGWNAQTQSYLNSYTSPVVIGQVMTENDADWSVFWSYGASRSSAPNASTLRTGKQVAEDSDTTRANESVGFIVVEAGSGNVGGSSYIAQIGADSITGATNSSTSYNFSPAFSSTPAFLVASMAGLDGGNGGWAFLDGASAINASGVTFAIDEDQIRDSERSHITEQVDYFAFENSVSLPLTPAP